MRFCSRVCSLLVSSHCLSRFSWLSYLYATAAATAEQVSSAIVETVRRNGEEQAPLSPRGGSGGGGGGWFGGIATALDALVSAAGEAVATRTRRGDGGGGGAAAAAAATSAASPAFPAAPDPPLSEAAVRCAMAELKATFAQWHVLPSPEWDARTGGSPAASAVADGKATTPQGLFRSIMTRGGATTRARARRHDGDGAAALEAFFAYQLSLSDASPDQLARLAADEGLSLTTADGRPKVPKTLRRELVRARYPAGRPKPAAGGGAGGAGPAAKRARA